MKLQKNYGFSLIEIVIAISIMAIMGALVIPRLTSYLRKARKQATIATLNATKLGIESYNSDTGDYPDTLEDLKVAPADERIARDWDGPYTKGKMQDSWKRGLVYTLNPIGYKPRYELYSWGPDGEGSETGLVYPTQ